MLKFFLLAAMLVIGGTALAQQQDPTKPESWLAYQRNQALDTAAVLAAANAKLRQEVAELQKKLAAREKARDDPTPRPE